MPENTFAGYAPQGQLAQILAARSAERKQAVVDRVMNEELEAQMAEGGDSVDITNAMAQAQLRAAKRLGQLGNHRDAAQLYRQGAELVNSGAKHNAELDGWLLEYVTDEDIEKWALQHLADEELDPADYEPGDLRDAYWAMQHLSETTLEALLALCMVGIEVPEEKDHPPYRANQTIPR